PCIAADGRDDGHQHGQGDDLLDGALEQGDDAGAQDGGEQVDAQPRHAATHDLQHAGRAVLVRDAGQTQDVLAVLFLNDVDDVIDGQLADQPPARIDHGRRDQVILLEDIGDFFLIDVDLDDVDRLHQLGQRRGARAAQHPADGHPADRAVHRIDDIDVEEELGQVVALGADVVDGVADVPELRRGHELALHQAAGRILFVAERGFDGGPVNLGHGGQHALALIVLKVFDHRGGVVRIELLQGFGQGGRGDPLQHLLADAVVHF